MSNKTSPQTKIDNADKTINFVNKAVKYYFKAGIFVAPILIGLAIAVYCFVFAMQFGDFWFALANGIVYLLVGAAVSGAAPLLLVLIKVICAKKISRLCQTEQITYRLARKSDLIAVMDVIKSAQKFLAEQKIDQWQDNFPTDAVISDDIEDRISYVFVCKGKIIGFVCLGLKDESYYNTLSGGKWLNNVGWYATIHRTAVVEEFRGLGIADLMFDLCLRQSKARGALSVRVDTHEDNLRMRHIIEKNHFTYCGEVRLPVTNAKRLAYELLIDPNKS